MATEMTLCVRGAAPQRELPRHLEQALQLWAALAAQSRHTAIYLTQIWCRTARSAMLTCSTQADDAKIFAR